MSAVSLPPSSLLFIKPGSFGDVIHALPCAAALKTAWPRTKLTWLIDERWQTLLADNPHVDELVVFPRQQFRGFTGKAKSLPWAFSLKRLQPDLALDLQGLIRSALMAKLSGAKRIVGLADAREGASRFYQDTVPVMPGEHSVLRYLLSLQTLGIPLPENPVFPLPPGQLPSETPTEPFILLHPFARGAGKSLSEEEVRELCQFLAPVRVVLAGNGTLNGSAPPHVTNLLNQTSIPELIGLLRAAAFVLSVDSGPMHIAAAIGAKLVSLHTWSDPRLVGPFSPHAWIWQGGSLRRQQLGTEVELPPAKPLNREALGEIATLALREMKV